MVAHWMDWANGNKDIPAILMTLFDVWVFKSQSFDLCPNIASWVPIDHSPCPEDVLRWCARPNVKPIAMSKFGEHMGDQTATHRTVVGDCVQHRPSERSVQIVGLIGV